MTVQSFVTCNEIKCLKLILIMLSNAFLPNSLKTYTNGSWECCTLGQRGVVSVSSTLAVSVSSRRQVRAPWVFDSDSGDAPPLPTAHRDPRRPTRDHHDCGQYAGPANPERKYSDDGQRRRPADLYNFLFKFR